MHCLSMAPAGGGCSSQKASLLCSSTLCSAWRTKGQDAAKALVLGGLADSLEALGEGQGRYGGPGLLALATALSLHLQRSH